MNSIIKEHELGLTEIISEGSKIFFFKFREISLLIAGAFIPINLIMTVINERFSSQGSTVSTTQIVLLLFLLLLQVIVGLIASMSIAIIVEKVIENKPTSLVEAIKYATSIWGKAFTTNLLSSVIIFGLTLLFIVPGIIYGTYYIFVLYVVALRDKYGREALSYSKMLVDRQWGRIFSILLVLGILFAIVNGAITFSLSKLSTDPYFGIITNALSLLISAVFGVMNVVLFLNNDFVYHHKLAQRKEMERLRTIKRASSIEPRIGITQKDKTLPTKSPTPKKTIRKTEHKTTRKTSTTKKITKTSSRKTVS